MDQERGEKPVLEGTVSSIIFQNEETAIPSSAWTQGRRK